MTSSFVLNLPLPSSLFGSLTLWGGENCSVAAHEPFYGPSAEANPDDHNWQKVRSVWLALDDTVTAMLRCQGVIFIPGNTLIVRWTTASDYVANVDAPRWGFKLKATGHALPSPSQAPLLHLERELAHVASICIGQSLQSVSEPIAQASAQKATGWKTLTDFNIDGQNGANVQDNVVTSTIGNCYALVGPSISNGKVAVEFYVEKETMSQVTTVGVAQVPEFTDNGGGGGFGGGNNYQVSCFVPAGLSLPPPNLCVPQSPYVYSYRFFNGALYEKGVEKMLGMPKVMQVRFLICHCGGPHFRLSCLAGRITPFGSN